MLNRNKSTSSNYTRLITAVTVVAAVAFVVLVMFLATQFAAPSGGTGGPKLVVDQERIDFGRVAFDKRVRAIFTITNAGDQPLQLATTDIPVKLVEGC